MTADEIRSWQIRRHALLALLNLEPRSFNQIAKDLGCTEAAISIAFTRLCRATGFASLFRRVETRQRNASAAKRRWAARKQSA
jgi:precorrin-6B methylase 2